MFYNLTYFNSNAKMRVYRSVFVCLVAVNAYLSCACMIIFMACLFVSYSPNIFLNEYHRCTHKIGVVYSFLYHSHIHRLRCRSLQRKNWIKFTDSMNTKQTLAPLKYFGLNAHRRPDQRCPVCLVAPIS